MDVLSDFNATRTGCTIWFTGLSGSGKTTCSALVAQKLAECGLPVEILDGDMVRENLSKGLGFSREDRDINIRRIGFVADLLTRHGVFVCVAAISPYRAVRDEVRDKVGRFVEVYCNAPLEVLEERDVKGLYRKAREGKIANFTGVSDPYEAPLSPDVMVDSSGQETPEQSAAKVLECLRTLGYLPTP